MTEQLHLMVPPNILLNNWESDWLAEREHAHVLLTQAYQAGADAELEECCKLLDGFGGDGGMIRRYRRPPTSLKKQALQELDKVDMFWCTEDFDQVSQKALDTIRKALEALPDD